MIYDYSKEINESILDEYYHNFDLERMKEALESPTIELPEGLTFKEKREFLLNFAKQE
jgi:hypothetical protein